MNISEYKEISRIYKRNSFKLQVVLRILYHSLLLLFVPLCVKFKVPYLIWSMILALFIIIANVILYVMEKKKFFLPRQYFHLYKYQIPLLVLCFLGMYYFFYVRMNLVIPIITSIVESGICFIEYKSFCSIMDKVKIK